MMRQIRTSGVFTGGGASVVELQLLRRGVYRADRLGSAEHLMLHITLYTKAGCHLCDEARAHLEDLAADHELMLDEVDIRRDPTLFERYRYRIPVIVVHGVERLEGQITAEDVRALVAP